MDESTVVLEKAFAEYDRQMAEEKDFLSVGRRARVAPRATLRSRGRGMAAGAPRRPHHGGGTAAPGDI